MASLKPSLVCEKQNMNLKSNVLIKTKDQFSHNPEHYGQNLPHFGWPS